MSEFIISHELTIRLGAFIGVFAVMALWEVIAPRRKLLLSRLQRWTSNLLLVALNSLLLRLLGLLARLLGLLLRLLGLLLPSIDLLLCAFGFGGLSVSF